MHIFTENKVKPLYSTTIFLKNICETHFLACYVGEQYSFLFENLIKIVNIHIYIYLYNRTCHKGVPLYIIKRQGETTQYQKAKSFQIGYICDIYIYNFSYTSVRVIDAMATSCIGLHTFRLRENGRHFEDDIFKCIFWNENMWILNNVSLKFIRKGPINNIPALVQIMAWRRSGDKPISELVVVSSNDTHMHNSASMI